MKRNNFSCVNCGHTHLVASYGQVFMSPSKACFENYIPAKANIPTYSCDCPGFRPDTLKYLEDKYNERVS